jgi:hypothetical protein
VDDRIGEIMKGESNRKMLMSAESKKSVSVQSKSPINKKESSSSVEKKTLKKLVGKPNYSPSVEKKNHNNNSVNKSISVNKPKQNPFSSSFEINKTLDTLMENKEELISKVYCIKQPGSKIIPAMKSSKIQLLCP